MIFRRSDYSVAAITQSEAAEFIKVNHYAKGCSHVSTYRFGLFDRAGRLKGATVWLPTTKRASAAVDHRWQSVMCLSRMAIAPDVPKNACSFTLARSIKAILADGRYHSFVTYADSRMGHEGHVYLASGWIPAGRSQPTQCWLDAQGRQVAQQSTKSRRKAEMIELGYKMVGSYRKRRFVLYPRDDVESKLLRLRAHIAWLTETVHAAIT